MYNKINQPDILKTDNYISSSGGKGNDVWKMLVSCISGNTDLVRDLLSKEPSLVNCNWAYFSPLHFAVKEGHFEIVNILLEYKAVAGLRSGVSWQDTPIQLAKDRGHTSIIKILEDYLQQTLHSNSLGESIATLIKQRKEKELKQLINNNVEAVYLSDERGNTPLHWAILTRQLKLVDFFIEKGADLEAKRADGCTVVQLALEGDYFYRPYRDLPVESIQNQWFILGYLISKGCQYNIFIASAIGDTEYIQDCLKKDPLLANTLDSSGRSALYYAAKFGNEQTVKVLLDYGANPNQAERDASKGAALYAAASSNHLSIAKMLLKHGADANAEVEASGNALFIAMKNNFKEMIELLYIYGGSITLTAACALGRLDLVGEIVAIKPSEMNAGDYGPLTQAVSSGYPRIVELLLKHDVELNSPWYASNYMCYAFRFSNLEMVQLLLDHGANPNLTNWLGISYLHLVALQGNIELARLLINYGADINAVDHEYCTTPLGWASKYGQAEMVTFLLKQGAKKVLEDVPEWATPLAWAKRKGHSAIVDILI